MVAREGRVAPNEPVVHYGTIASGDRVMKDAIERDRIGQETEGAICFEMEASLMNSFRCIVIWGISDYADSHKNDVWQPYAVATGAALAKELLSYFDPIPSHPPADDTPAPSAGPSSRPDLLEGTGNPDSHPNLVATYSGMEDWLRTFQPSTTSTVREQPGSSDLIKGENVSVKSIPIDDHSH